MSYMENNRKKTVTVEIKIPQELGIFASFYGELLGIGTEVFLENCLNAV